MINTLHNNIYKSQENKIKSHLVKIFNLCPNKERIHRFLDGIRLKKQNMPFSIEGKQGQYSTLLTPNSRGTCKGQQHN